MMTALDFAIELLLKHPDVGVMTGIAVFIVYEVRWGVIQELTRDVHDLRERFDGACVILYRIARREPDTDAQAVRDVLWDNGRSFPDDFDEEGRYVGRDPRRDGEYHPDSQHHEARTGDD